MTSEPSTLLVHGDGVTYEVDLAACRLALCCEVEHVARCAGCKPEVVTDFLTGTRAPSLATTRRIVTVLGVGFRRVARQVERLTDQSTAGAE